MSSNTFSLLSLSVLLFCCSSLSFSLSMFHSCRGPVGRGLIPSAWGFCQSLVPFCVMVLTERTPHLTPIELWGWAAGRPARANVAPVFSVVIWWPCLFYAVPLWWSRKSLWAFCFSTFTARSGVLTVVTLRKNNICPYIRSKQAFFHISVRDTHWFCAFHWFGTSDLKGGGGPHLESIAPLRKPGVFLGSYPGPFPIPLSKPHHFQLWTKETTLQPYI